MNEPQMASFSAARGRPGFYFRVLEEGEVEAGVRSCMRGNHRSVWLEDALKYLIRDRDRADGEVFTRRIRAMGQAARLRQATRLNEMPHAAMKGGKRWSPI